MNIKDIISIIDGKVVKEMSGNYNKITTNSKEVEQGDIFLAINKGHQYIEDAFLKGAIAVITEQEVINNKYIYVPSTVAALGKIARYYREYYNKPVIAITGSTGKTTTKEFLSQILSRKYHVLKSEKNHNNHIGLPETLLKLNDDIDVVVLELGMNHLKEISYLSSICKPDYAIITNIGTAHIGNLGSKKNILKAKLEIIEGMENGFLIINGLDKLLKKVKSSKVQIKKTNLKKCKNIKYELDETQFDYILNKKKYHFQLPFMGKHILQDFLLVLTVAILLEVDIKDIQDEAKYLKKEEGRYNIYQKEITVIDDTYNSSYESLKQSLKLLRKREGHKIIILGDMLEFGTFSRRYHFLINFLLLCIFNKEVLLIGKETKVILGKHFTNLLSLKLYLKNHIQKNDIVFIKGSRGMKLDKIVADLTK